MGYAACVDAEKNHPISGIIGGGCGASVGKICGRERATKTGLGIYAVSAGDLMVAAVVVLNALGDIYDPSTGTRSPDQGNQMKADFMIAGKSFIS